MKTHSEWSKCMQIRPVVAESYVKPEAYSRYSSDIPTGKMRLNTEYGEYREYHTAGKLSWKIIFNDNDKNNIFEINRVVDIPDIPDIPFNLVLTPPIVEIGRYGLDTETADYWMENHSTPKHPGNLTMMYGLSQCFTISGGMAFVAFGDPVSAKVPMREKVLDFRGNASNNATNATSQTSGNPGWKGRIIKEPRRIGVNRSEHTAWRILKNQPQN